MDINSDTERAKYDKVWLEPEYRKACHSLQLWKTRRDIFPSPSSALDIGCGRGLLIDEWNAHGIDGWGVDISRNSISKSLKNLNKVVFVSLWEMVWETEFDLGVCADVMEHIPEEYVNETLRRIYACCDEVVFKIAHNPSVFVGETVHMTLQPAKWWMREMSKIGGKAEFIGTATRSGMLDSLMRWKHV